MFNIVKGIKDTAKNAVSKVKDNGFVRYAMNDETAPAMIAMNAIGAVSGIAAGILYANDLMDKKDLATVLAGEGLIAGADALWVNSKLKEYDKKLDQLQRLEFYKALLDAEIEVYEHDDYDFEIEIKMNK